MHGPRPIRRRFAKLVLLAALAAAPVAAAPAPSLPEVRPGGLVRWPGEGVTACIQGERRWTPLWTTCFYPVDLFTPAGSLEIGRERGGHVETRTVRVTEYPYATQTLTIADEGKVDMSAADARRVEREQAKILALLGEVTPRRFSLPLGTPLASLPEGGRFGHRRILNGQPRSPHTGADYKASTGTPVLAVADGTVVLAEDHFLPGNAVVVDHGDGLFTMAFHLDTVAVKPGDPVKKGDPVGTVGATGRVTGPHLHFAVRWHGARIDPELLLGRDKATTVD